MNELKKIIKSTVVYFIGNVTTKLVAFFLIPIYTKYLTPFEYGLYDLSIAYIELIVSILFLDIWSGIMRFMYDYSTREEKRSVIPNGLVIYGGSVLLYSIFFLILNKHINLNYGFLVYLYGLFLTIQSLYSYISRALGFNKEFAVSGVLSTLTNAFSNIFLIVVIDYDYKALFISYVLGILVQCIYLEMKVHLLSTLHLKLLNKDLIIRIFTFSAPLCVNSFCYWLLTGFNKVIISNQLSLADNGYYAIASKFSVAITLVSSCFTMAWQECAYGKSDNSLEESEFYSKATSKYVNILFLSFLVILPSIAIIFPYFVNSDYMKAKNIIPAYIIATILSVFSSFLSNIISAYKKNGYIFISTFLACITNIICALILIPKFGVIGACMALAIGYAINCYVRILSLRKLIQMKFDFKKLLYIVPFSMICVYCYNNFAFIYQLLFIICTFLIGLFIYKREILEILHIFLKK